MPIVIDAEKDRPYLRDLIPYADYICTNTAFPRTFTDRYDGCSIFSCYALHIQGAYRGMLTRPGCHIS